ncbi:MAG: hypothetical protein ABEJ92_10980 [Halobacteriales archaeon]
MSQADDVERLLDDLLAAGVFEATPDGELRLTDAFRREREERRREAGSLGDAFESTVAEYATSGDVDPSAVSPETLGDAMAVFHTAAGVDRERSLLAAEALQRIESTERRSGIPEGFVHLNVEDIDGFMAAHDAAVIYCWGDDCDPCDGAKEDYEALLADGVIPDWVGLGAVYGPEAPELLRERYEVAVAPTTLFCVEGQIDSRVVGNPGYGPLRSEIETIMELAG